MNIKKTRAIVQKKGGIEIAIKIFYDLPNLLGGVICTFYVNRILVNSDNRFPNGDIKFCSIRLMLQDVVTEKKT